MKGLQQLSLSLAVLALGACGGAEPPLARPSSPPPTTATSAPVEERTVVTPPVRAKLPIVPRPAHVVEGSGSFDSSGTTRVTFDNTQPNGILVSPDQKTLYVAESNYTKGITRELRAYPINEDGTLGKYTNLFTWGEDHHGVHRAIDGMCLDIDGNIVATNGWEVAGPGAMITIFSPTGRVLEMHPVPAIRPTNCCFGGPDMTTLFVTTTQGHLFKTQTDRVGWAMYP